MVSILKTLSIVNTMTALAISTVASAGSVGDEARRLTGAAEESFDQGRYEQALAGFERTMAYRPTASVALAVARCHILLGNGDLAVFAIDRFLAASDRHRNSLPMQEATAAIAGSGGQIQDEQRRRALLTQLQSAVDRVNRESAELASGSELRFGTGADSDAAGSPREAARLRGVELFRAGIEAVQGGDDGEALAAFERSMAYRQRRNTLYNIAVCHVLLGHRDLASTCLDAYLRGRQDESDDPRVQAVRRALDESPGDLGDTDRRNLLWQGLSEGVDDPVRVTAGGSDSREVPDHLDRTLASIESSFHTTVGGNTTCFLVGVARSKSEYLLHPPAPQGPCQRGAVARSLILIDEELDRRLARAPLGPAGYPELECLDMDPDSPLAGDLSEVPPFSMLDAWTAIHSESSRQCPSELSRPTPAPRPVHRSSTRTPTPTPTPRELTTTPPGVSPTPTPTPSASSCARRENWIACALRDPEITSFRIRHILQTYPNLAREFITYPGVCTILQNSGWDLEDIEVIGRGDDPNRWIQGAKETGRDYESFVAALRDLERRVNASAAFISSCETDQQGCPGTIWSSCLLLREQWYWPRQRNSSSVFFLPR